MSLFLNVGTSTNSNLRTTKPDAGTLLQYFDNIVNLHLCA